MRRLVTDQAIVGALRTGGACTAAELRRRLALAQPDGAWYRRLERLAVGGLIVEVAVLQSAGQRGGTSIWGVAAPSPPPLVRRPIAGECLDCTCHPQPTDFRTDPFTGLTIRTTPCPRKAAA